MADRSLAGVGNVCLIGSGDLLVDTAQVLKGKRFTVSVILAPRHVDEVLPLLGGQVGKRLKEAGVAVHVVDDINDMSSWPAKRLGGAAALALCFGPAWIFSAPVRAAFGLGMINVNMIPIPRYLGGAHYSWQILNRDRSGGCFLQEITGDVDRGDILFKHRFQLSKSARVPEDYFKENFEQGRRCVGRFIASMTRGKAVKREPFQRLEEHRLYFPRLMTAEQGFIDWSWTADEIARFCNAFDRPYPGAITFLDGVLVRLKDVAVERGIRGFHPFCAGLIVRATGKSGIIVSARDGAVCVGSVRDASGNTPKLRERRRFMTAAEHLEHALAFRPRLSAKGFKQ